MSFQQSLGKNDIIQHGDMSYLTVLTPLVEEKKRLGRCFLTTTSVVMPGDSPGLAVGLSLSLVLWVFFSMVLHI